MVLEFDAGLSKLLDRGSRSGTSLPASPLADILQAEAEMEAVVAFVLGAVKEEHCSVVQGHSQAPQEALASAANYSLFLSQAEERTPLSLFCVFALDFRFYNGRACRLHHKNGFGHAFDRESGADHESVFDHARISAHGSACGDCAGVFHLLAVDKTLLQVVNAPSCSSGAGE